VASVPAHVLPLIRSPSVAGSGNAAATTSRGATSTPFTGMRSGRISRMSSSTASRPEASIACAEKRPSSSEAATAAGRAGS
jgi:hypothetical protein